MGTTFCSTTIGQKFRVKANHIVDLKTYLVQKWSDDEKVQFQLNKAPGMKRSELLIPKPERPNKLRL